jgi:hypothetical protein
MKSCFQASQGTSVIAPPVAAVKSCFVFDSTSHHLL